MSREKIDSWEERFKKEFTTSKGIGINYPVNINRHKVKAFIHKEIAELKASEKYWKEKVDILEKEREEWWSKADNPNECFITMEAYEELKAEHKREIEADCCADHCQEITLLKAEHRKEIEELNRMMNNIISDHSKLLELVKSQCADELKEMRDNAEQSSQWNAYVKERISEGVDNLIKKWRGQ